jgi:hypothetical protein
MRLFRRSISRKACIFMNLTTTFNKPDHLSVIFTAYTNRPRPSTISFSFSCVSLSTTMCKSDCVYILHSFNSANVILLRRRSLARCHCWSSTSFAEAFATEHSTCAFEVRSSMLTRSSKASELSIRRRLRSWFSRLKHRVVSNSAHGTVMGLPTQTPHSAVPAYTAFSEPTCATPVPAHSVTKYSIL